MSFNLNSVCLAGRLTRAPELKAIGADRQVCAFSIAINEMYKSRDGEKKETATFVECEAWGRTAELIGQYLIKGSGVYLSGKLKLEEWEDKEGKKRSRLKVVADSVQFLDNKGERSGERSEEATTPAPTQTGSTPARPAPAPADDEPPF